MAPFKATNVEIKAIGGALAGRADLTAPLLLHLPDCSTPIEFAALCLRRVGISTPSATLSTGSNAPWRDQTLADPHFERPGTVDLLLGADIVPQLLRPGLLRYHDLVAQNTAVGWAIWGRQRAEQQLLPIRCHALSSSDEESPWHNRLLALLQRFWELEDVPLAQRVRPIDEWCENLFAQHRREPTGRYVVRLPLKPGANNQLGSSESAARASLASLHRRMKRDPQFTAEYRKFMSQYEALGHMKQLQATETLASGKPIHYIPHHGIWQRSDGGPKLRVVFDASRPTSSGLSLNDLLHSGPKLQRDLWIVLLRWRTHRIAFCTDVQMMFRQITVDERDVDWQRILWSKDDDEPVRHYQLQTVTYGTACAPYLALRTLQQLCEDEHARFPATSAVLMSDRYVDDILSGAHEVHDARVLRDQLIQLMRAGGFPLRKWVANHSELLDDMNSEELLRPTWITFDRDGPVKELGVSWNPRDDVLRLGSSTAVERRLSKRKVLAELAAVFDPCGWAAPTILLAKMLVQDLWRAKLEWDEELPESMSRRWLSIRQDLSTLTEVSIPRWIGVGATDTSFTVHAFANASRRAMAAVAYSRVEECQDKVTVRLLIAKTKLSPIRCLRPASTSIPRMTIPRLELRAALIAARLLRAITEELHVDIKTCSAWTDSTIALH
ncbi:hypothetical protein TKK_0012568 [Trichogramma kaykai]|uniref:Reverse transcriptase domain-containing protein n=1 Tax=Trichogramma kaykai TaxID=54128 RepID=A0ABD2WME2_9HYME